MEDFRKLGISNSIERALADMGFDQPTDIQKEAIPLLMQGSDLMAQAKTGTGKTAAFGIPLIERLDARQRGTQGLVLTPTRELCQQVCAELRKIGKYSGVSIVGIYGGQDMNIQTRELHRGVHIIVGTPGRMLDHIRRQSMDLRNVKMVVIDEADRMLDMGFIHDVETILDTTPKHRQTMLFSATMQPEIKHLAAQHMHTPEFVKVSEDETDVVTHIKQEFIVVDPWERVNALLAYLKKETPSLAMIFCRTRHGADRLGMILDDRGLNSACLHGDMPQAKRDRVMRGFREGKIHMLVATDIAARGIDVDDVSHIVNYNMPDGHTTYAHRVGRTGRMGKGGSAFTLVARDELGKLGEIERALGIEMAETKFDGIGTGVKPAHLGPPRTNRPYQHRYGARPSTSSYGSHSRGSRPRGRGRF